MELMSYGPTEAHGTDVLQMRPPDSVGDLLAANVRLRAENVRLYAKVQRLQALMDSVIASYHCASDGKPLPE